MALAVVYLAAGKGTRMKSDLPKVLHPVGSAPMMAHAMQAAGALEPDRSVVVVGHGADQMRQAVTKLNPDAEVVLQEEQLGTGHAVAQAKDALGDFEGDLLILYADTPFVMPNTLRAMLTKRQSADLVVLGFETQNPARYGRLVTSGEDRLERIVEFKDANDAEKAITLCNSGMMVGDCQAMLSMLGDLTNDNASGEYYLTDLPGLAKERGLMSAAVRGDESEAMGINTRAELAAAEAFFQKRRAAEVMAQGVTLIDPTSVFFSLDTELGQDCIIEPNVFFGPGVKIAPNVHIKAFCHIEGTEIAQGAIIGPFARLRPKTCVEEGAKIGNFVEVKNLSLGKGAKINHLTYVGDATVGAAANIGAGTVTCNYDGVLKHRTEIGDGAFIGSGSMIVAPVHIGANAMTASGSVITQDVPDEALALGRARQENKPGFATKLRKILQERKKKLKP